MYVVFKTLKQNSLMTHQLMFTSLVFVDNVPMIYLFHYNFRKCDYLIYSYSCQTRFSLYCRFVYTFCTMRNIFLVYTVILQDWLLAGYTNLLISWHINICYFVWKQIDISFAIIWQIPQKDNSHLSSSLRCR